MRSIRLLTVAVLAVILALSSTQSVYAQQISLNPTCGPPGTVVTVTGSGFTRLASSFCEIRSNPSGLVGPTRGIDFDCNINNQGEVTGPDGPAFFIVASGASGSYSVTVWYAPSEEESAPVGFTTDCPAVGGVLMPANTLALLAPWLAVIGLVGCIGTIVVVAKKRQP